MQNNNVVCADCLETLKKMKTEKIDLIYLDPPFFYAEYSKFSIK